MTAFMQVSPAVVLFNIDWGDDLAQVVVCHAGLVGTTDSGWTAGVGEMLELVVLSLACVVCPSGTRDLRCSFKPSLGVTLLTNVRAAAALFLQVPGL